MLIYIIDSLTSGNCIKISYEKKIASKKDFVRSGIRTHAHIRGPERSVRTKSYALESGALDRSAILTLLYEVQKNFKYFRHSSSNAFVLDDSETIFQIKYHCQVFNLQDDLQDVF